MSALSPPTALRYDDYPLRNLPILLSFHAKGILTEYRTVLENLTIYKEAGDLPLQYAQVRDFRPFYTFLIQTGPIRDDFADIIDCQEELAKLEATMAGKPPDRTLKLRWIYHGSRISISYREIQQALDMARIWRGVSNMILGIHKTRTLQDCVPMAKPHTLGLDRHLDIQGSQLMLHNHSSGAPTSGQSWLPLSPFLYPQHTPVPIHYVTTMRSVRLISQRFADSSVLGIDVVMMEPPKTGPNALKSRINFLLIASEFEVAIIDMDCMPISYEILAEQPFQQTLGNPKIVKVGVHTELQRRILAGDNCIDLVNAVDLATEQPPPDDYSDPTFQTLSNMVNANFGSFLPKLSMSKNVLYQAGKDDPSLYFGHLASRPFAALQLLNKTRAQRSRQLLHESSTASLGPILIHPFQKDLSRWTRFMIKLAPPLRGMRQKYIEALLEGLRTQVVRRNPYLYARRATYLGNDWRRTILTGYILMTTFGQSVQKVSFALMPALWRKVETKYRLSRSMNATEQNLLSLFALLLLSFARKAKLPLNSGHETQLRDMSQRLSVTELRPGGRKLQAWLDTFITGAPDREAKGRDRFSAAPVEGAHLDTASTATQSSTAFRPIVNAKGKTKLSQNIEQIDKKIGRDIPSRPQTTNAANKGIYRAVPSTVLRIRRVAKSERGVTAGLLLNKPRYEVSVPARKGEKVEEKTNKVEKTSGETPHRNIEVPSIAANILSSFGLVNTPFKPMLTGASSKGRHVEAADHENVRDDSSHHQKPSTVEKSTKDRIPAKRPLLRRVWSAHVVFGSFKVPARRTRKLSGSSPTVEPRVGRPR